ncbi:hypothetical protein NECAME_07165 [Necator americanus]|uniref:Uncharacterized protein n=1 Tax=Necator americanus TaxID=51031 RepID=W2TQ18_NECAM|nr:hypothetical protein NECAME_07165 [Necator americanus]ETN83873.1 hypothetical protein NECAME_07165 [Necator americanus]
MSEKSAADDFFGIEHMSSQFGAEEGERKEGSTAENREVEKAFTGLNLEKVDKQQSGTEFFDRAFFGEFKHERITCEQETNHSVDFFEENFFKKLPSESKIAVPFTKKVREQHLCEGVTEDHLQLEGRTVPVRTLRNLQEDVTGKKGQEKVVPSLEEYVENEVVGHRSEEVSGLHNIRSMITPIWRMNDEELVDFMTKRIIYKDGMGFLVCVKKIPFISV